jgi:dienelactone hydrolase
LEEEPITEESNQMETLETSDYTEDIDWNFFNQRAEEFIIRLAGGDFDIAHSMLDQTMAGILDPSALQALWEEAVALSGEFIEIYDIENDKIDEHYISGVIGRHEEVGFGWNVVFSEDGLIAGLFTGGIVPLSQENDTDQTNRLPIQGDGFTSYPIIIGEGGDFPLDGLLSIPDDITDLVPAAVILHGSGPHNMDGLSIGNLYKDIAEFLAANGIAVIRYDKRTFTHGNKMIQELGGSLTVWEESVEDAILATEILKAHPSVDENRVFIIGHSLGGALAPRTHNLGGDFAGLILMAGSPRTLSEIFIEQVKSQVTLSYDAGLIDSISLAESLVEVDAIEELFASIANMTDEEAKGTATLLGSGYYMKDIENPSFLDQVSKVTAPILVMQGGRDFQVLADVDFALLREILADRDNITFELYENLNHLFMPSTATNFLEHAHEFMENRNISVYIPALQDIVDWIHGL